MPTRFTCGHDSPPASLPSKTSSTNPPASLPHACRMCMGEYVRDQVNAVHQSYHPNVTRAEDLIKEYEKDPSMEGQSNLYQAKKWQREIAAAEQREITACWADWRKIWLE